MRRGCQRDRRPAPSGPATGAVVVLAVADREEEAGEQSDAGEAEQPGADPDRDVAVTQHEHEYSGDDEHGDARTAAAR